MSTLAGIGMGTTFAIGDGAGPEVFTTVAEVFALTPPDITRDSIDATHFGSPSRTREFIPGLRDPGEVTIEANFTEAGYAALLAKMNSNAVSNYKVVFPLIGAQATTGSNLVFAGFVTSLGTTDPMDGKRMVTAKFKLSGVATYTAGS